VVIVVSVCCDELYRMVEAVDYTRRSRSHRSQSQILVENLDFWPRYKGVPVGVDTVWYGKKTRIVWLTDGEKKFDDMFSRFDRIPACDRRTDRQTDINLASA